MKGAHCVTEDTRHLPWTTPSDTAEAMALARICRSCPVLDSCEAYAKRIMEEYGRTPGVWAGRIFVSAPCPHGEEEDCMTCSAKKEVELRLTCKNGHQDEYAVSGAGRRCLTCQNEARKMRSNVRSNEQKKVGLTWSA